MIPQNVSHNLIPLPDAEARLRHLERQPSEPSKPSKGLEEPKKHPFEPFEGDRSSRFSWGEPKPLPSGLLPVAPFDTEFLPKSVSPWVLDISERMQCPPDFLGASAMVGLSATLGRKVGIRPQTFTDWIEVPNLWGCVIARPGAMKSPAMNQAFAPLHRLEANARKANEEAAAEYLLALEAHKLRKDEAARKARSALKDGADIGGILDVPVPQEPASRRYIVTDATYESLGAILAENPNGVLAFRDELISLLKTLDREEYSAARGFFLTAWNGTSGYTFDRIIRGRTHIEAACISLMGSTQPARFAEYVRRALSGGSGDDGLIQRFGLLVWPDQQPEWRDVDRYPNSEARSCAWETFRHLDELSPEALGAERDEFESIPFLRFDDAGAAIFKEWREPFERKLRGGDLHPALESHLAKYRKLVSAISLIGHLADKNVGPIGEMAVLRAVSFSEYLETHARRAYAAGSEAETAAAKAILSRIRKGDLISPFSARDVHQRNWSNLSERGQVQAGLDLLSDLDWLAPELKQTGGRPSQRYHVNPRGLQ
jgi:putative DNA primase/helicase